jgi:hypothetical protein
MDVQNIWTVFITAITVLGSASAWRFYEKRADKKREDELTYRYDCRERISKLEALLEESSNHLYPLDFTAVSICSLVYDIILNFYFIYLSIWNF